MDFYLDTDAVNNDLDSIEESNGKIIASINALSENFGTAWQGPGADTVIAKIKEMKTSTTQMTEALTNLRGNVNTYIANTGKVDEVKFNA